MKGSTRCVFVGLIALLLIQAKAQVSQQSKTELFLLAATPASGTNVPGFPARLYRIADKKLAIVRVVMPSTSSTAAVINAASMLCILPEPLSGAPIAVVDKSEPEKKINIPFTRQYGYPYAPSAVVATIADGDDRLIFPVFQNKIGSSPTLADLRFVTQPLSGGGQASSSVAPPDAYGDAFTTESIAGPYNWESPLTAHNGQKFSLQFAGHDVFALAPQAPDIAPASQAHNFVLAANESYLVAHAVLTGSDATAIMTATQSRIDVFDRASKSWRVLNVEGNANTPKLFGNWISWSVTQTAGKEIASPGREAERSFNTEELPNVAEAYFEADGGPDEGNHVVQPGRLILDNPHDSWHFQIITGHEDSEVIFADAKKVLYRVDDKIYSIELDAGHQKGQAVLLVQDVDVPEVHWGFFGPAM
jgi:hypothetical protein